MGETHGGWSVWSMPFHQATASMRHTPWSRSSWLPWARVMALMSRSGIAVDFPFGEVGELADDLGHHAGRVHPRHSVVQPGHGLLVGGVGVHDGGAEVGGGLGGG